MNWTMETIEKRIIRYGDLIPCKNAFVDTRSPGSDQKENFTLIGPGVSENPNQHVHIAEPHGFNIGGARQPNGCLNSQHSHLTAEVFIAHKSQWRFHFGVNADEGSVELNQGDTISIPTNMFRGFENIGDETGFLFAILGRDNPGRVTWAPSVFELAKKHGLILLKGGKLIDTTLGETLPDNAKIETAPNDDEIAALSTPPEEQLKRCVAFFDKLKANTNSPLHQKGVSESAIIMPKITEDGFHDAPIIPWWEHQFHVRKVSIESGCQTKWHQREEVEIIFVHDGELTFSWRDEDGSEQSIHLNQGDTMSVPKELHRCFRNEKKSQMDAFVVRGGDTIKAPKF